MKELQKKIDEVFKTNFGYTPLSARLNDIESEIRELVRFTDIKSLQNETGDALSSLIQLCNESGWDVEQTIQNTINKINNRKTQYKSLGRKWKIALLGGAFDMITLGHIEIARFVLNTSNEFDEVWLVPAYKHINNKQMISYEHRFTMCQIAAKTDGRIKVFDYEKRNELAGETYHLLNTLINDVNYDNFNFSFIIGLDNANAFSQWVNYKELEKLVRFIVVPRVGYDLNLNAWYLKSPHIVLTGELETPIMEVSSTFVKGKINVFTEEEITKFIDKNVYNYIKDNNLYKS
jgi:nicotinate-nucleotide adenylyltransferase